MDQLSQIIPPYARNARCDAKFPPEDGHAAARLASFGLAAVLIVLPAFALWAAIATYQAGEAARRSSGLSDIFEQARYAVGGEESLERKYRLEPSPEVRARHRAAGVSLTTALRDAS